MLGSTYLFLIIMLACKLVVQRDDESLREMFLPTSFHTGTTYKEKVPQTPVINKNEVPVLCYHQIRDWKKGDSKIARSYIVSAAKFKKQIAMLRDNGYAFILPDELIAFKRSGKNLPKKPLVLSFDDASATQYREAVPELNRYNIKAVFFVMTVVLNRPGYMSASEVKTLADQGHVIGGHTWDHHDVRNYGAKDWKMQFENPKNQLEKITGKQVKYFAYPYGTWNHSAIEVLRKNNMAGAFQLAARVDTVQPLFTIRRIIVDGYWNEQQLSAAIKNSFK